MEEVKVGSRYQHFKGKTYKILAIAHHSETEEKLVIYQAEYDSPEFGPNAVWARPYDMFLETIERDGETMRRFKLIEE